MEQTLWDYQGVLLPRGCVVQGRASEADLMRLEQLAAAHASRRAAGGNLAAPARPQADSQYLQAFCGLLRSHGFNAMGTATFSDKVAYGRYILSPLKAVQVVAHSITKETPFGTSLGFRGKLFITPEWHRSGRAVPHVHFALKTTTADPQKCCNLIKRHLSNTFGRSTCEVMRDLEKGTLYGLKDTLKETAFYPNAYYLSLRERGR